MSETATRSIRGAIDVPENTKDSILKHCHELLIAMLEENSVSIHDVSVILFTTTQDLDAVYPAQAAREMGFISTSLMCMQEMYVVGSMEKCLRIMILWNSTKEQAQIRHVYLGKAAQLRPEFNAEKQGGGEQ